ncbi:MAG: PilZ domain-containing protein [Candidatus Lambdaproteobacteria bacterium]|nr:PilZ domain-containing protein [Candidatus Lambdaproteobacteria bacterium]
MKKQRDENRNRPLAVWNHETELEHWRAEYLMVKHEPGQGREGHPIPEQLTALIEGMDSYPDQERRAEPRYHFEKGARIFAHLGPKSFSILNISVNGIAFYSDVSFELGTRLLMSALGMVAIEVEVLSCEMEETDAELMEYRYRVRAKFGPLVNGYQVYVLAREMYLEQLKQEGRPGL